VTTMVPGVDESTERLRRLATLEREHDLFAHRVDGWSAWRVLRNPVHRLVSGLPMSQLARSNTRRGAQALAATAGLLRLLVTAGRRELLVKTCRSALRLPQGDRYRDVYFDGLLQRGMSCLKLEEINSPDFEAQAAAAWRPADLDPVVFTFWGRVLGTLRPVDDGGFSARVARLLAEELGVDASPAWLRMRLSTVYWQAKLYAALLARVRPAAVLVADTGEYALCLACARRGVRFVELQHGVFDASHPDAVPEWAEGTAAELLLPDRLACRGTYWVEQLAGTRQGRDHAVAVGNELIDMARERRARRSPGEALHLVFTSQGLDAERTAAWLAEMVDAAPAGREWRLSIKLHPAYDARTVAFDALATHPRVRVIGGAEQPNVFDLLADADLHLSISSACHFDAAGLAVPSVVVPLASHEMMLDVVDGEQIALARTPADVWALAARGGAVAVAGPERFATPGFVDNFARLVAG
jgi:hypothetical protein